jgi:hypothetical protein
MPALNSRFRGGVSWSCQFLPWGSELQMRVLLEAAAT